MMRKTTILAAMAFAASATFAKAEEHVVIYLGNAFFPEISYVKPGDVIRFVNSSAASVTVVGSENQWSVGPVAINSDATIEVDHTTALEFSGQAGGTDTSGRLSFSPAPLG